MYLLLNLSRDFDCRELSVAKECEVGASIIPLSPALSTSGPSVSDMGPLEQQPEVPEKLQHCSNTFGPEGLVH